MEVLDSRPETIRAAAEIEPTAEDLLEIEDAASKIEIRGARYSESWQRLVSQ